MSWIQPALFLGLIRSVLIHSVQTTVQLSVWPLYIQSLKYKMLTKDVDLLSKLTHCNLSWQSCIVRSETTIEWTSKANGQWVIGLSLTSQLNNTSQFVASLPEMLLIIKTWFRCINACVHGGNAVINIDLVVVIIYSHRQWIEGNT